MGNQKKTDNHNLSAKLKLRIHFLDKYHNDGSAKVLDCCQGGAVIWDAIAKTHTLKSYWGVDVKPKKGRIKIESSRILQQKGLSENIIDIDTYGSPWKHWKLVLQNCQVPLTVFLTIGSTMFRGSTDSTAIETLGLSKLSHHLPESFFGKLSQLSTEYALAEALKTCRIQECLEAVSDGNARYIGIRLEQKTPVAVGPTTGEITKAEN